MAKSGFANLPALSRDMGAKVGSLRLGKYQTDVQAYQAERAADRADRELQLREQEAKDKREALRRWLKERQAKLRALKKITGGEGGEGLSPDALGPEPAPPPMAGVSIPYGQLQYPERTSVGKGRLGWAQDTPQVVTGGGKFDPDPNGVYRFTPGEGQFTGGGGGTGRFDGRSGAVTRLGGSGQRIIDVVPTERSGIVGAGAGAPGPSGPPGIPASEPAYPGPLGPARQHASQEELDEFMVRQNAERTAQDEMGLADAEAAQRSTGLVGDMVRQNAERTAQEEMRLADAEAAQRSAGLVGDAEARGQGKAQADAIVNRIVQSGDVGVSGPVPGAGVPSRPFGFTPSTRPAGYPRLSPGEAESTRRAGGLVLHGAPRATDYAMPQRREAPPPQARGALGAAAKKRYHASLDKLQKAAVVATGMGDGELASALQLAAKQMQQRQQAAVEAETEENVANGVVGLQNAQTRDAVKAVTGKLSNRYRANPTIRMAMASAYARIAAEDKTKANAAKVAEAEDVAEASGFMGDDYKTAVDYYGKVIQGQLKRGGKQGVLIARFEAERRLRDIFHTHRKAAMANPAHAEKLMEAAKTELTWALERLPDVPASAITPISSEGRAWLSANLKGLSPEEVMQSRAGILNQARYRAAEGKAGSGAWNDYFAIRAMLDGLTSEKAQKAAEALDELFHRPPED